MDYDEFSKHFMEINRPLKTYLLGVSGSLPDAEDMLQTVWKTLWEKIDEFDETRSFKAWAFGMARFQALKWKQSKARSREILSDEIISLLAETVEEESEEISSQCHLVAESVDKMNDLPRSVLQMKYIEQMSSAEISEKIGKSVPAIDMMLVRLRREIRDYIKERI
jgi:RNA polymerase sigma-70 factor (ECF subfamily)